VKKLSGGKLVVVTFKCSGSFKKSMDVFVENFKFDSRSAMIRQAIAIHMKELKWEK